MSTHTRCVARVQRLTTDAWQQVQARERVLHECENVFLSCLLLLFDTLDVSSAQLLMQQEVKRDSGGEHVHVRMSE